MNEGKIITQSEQAKHCPKNSCHPQQTRGLLSYAQIWSKQTVCHIWQNLQTHVHVTLPFLKEKKVLVTQLSFSVKSLTCEHFQVTL